MSFQEQIEDLSRIIELQQAVATSRLLLYELMNFICEQTRTLTNAHGTVVELAENEEMVYKACAGSLKASLGLRLNIHTSLSGLSVKKNEVLHCKDSEIDERVNREACRKVGARSMICVPLYSEGKTIGVLKVVSPEKEKFSEREVSLLRLIAGLLSATIDQAAVNFQKELAHKSLIESEKKFKTLIEAANDGVMLSKDGYAFDMNPAFCALFGYDKSEVVSIPVYGFIVEEERERVRKIVESGYSEAYQVVCLRKDGTTFIAEIVGKPLVINNEKIRMSQIRDITKMKKVEEALRDSVEKSNQAIRAKSEFLANMSHEVRTPLNGIMGMAGLLKETSLTTEQAKYVNIINNSADNLLILVNDILDFSKIEARKMSIEVIEFELKSIVEDIFHILSPLAKSKNLNFQYEYAPGLPPFVFGDPTRIRQILMNLVNNALKFTAQGSVTIKVSKIKEQIQFEVIDTGIGIPKEAMAKMFMPFSQVDASTTRRFGGTGLGLSISKQLIEIMNGSLGVESEEGKGSNFKFILPLPFGKEKEQSNQTYSFAKPDLKCRLLIAEDNQVNGLIARNIVEKMGHTATLVGSGKEVLEALELAPYDLILMDCHMPEMDGNELTRAIRGISKPWNNIAIIGMTTNTMVSDREIYITSGMNDCVPRSMRLEDINQVINGLMAQKAGGTPLSVSDKLAKLHLKILLVDDAEDNRQLIMAYLKKFPFEVIIAENGLIALDKMKQEKFDLVLMDMQMPVMDGLTATREYRLWEKNHSSTKVPIAALSAHALSEEMKKSLEAGCNIHLTKPIKKTTLLESIWDLTKV